MAARRPDWLPRMWGALEAAAARPFAFGSHDCVRLTASVLDAMTGSAWSAELDELYTGDRGALRVMGEPGRLEELVSARLGEPVPPLLARRGDVVAFDNAGAPAIGICTGERIACAADPAGVEYVKLERARCAWRVG